jgi:hypothetical protein
MASIKTFKFFIYIGQVWRRHINRLTPELNPSAQRCLTKYFTGDFAS